MNKKSPKKSKSSDLENSANGIVSAPKWFVYAGISVVLFAVSSVAKMILGRVEPKSEAEANPAKAGAGENGAHVDNMAADDDASDMQRERALNNQSGSMASTHAQI